jgi:hypothetical protein
VSWESARRYAGLNGESGCRTGPGSLLTYGTRRVKPARNTPNYLNPLNSLNFLNLDLVLRLVELDGEVAGSLEEGDEPVAVILDFGCELDAA